MLKEKILPFLTNYLEQVDILVNELKIVYLNTEDQLLRLVVEKVILDAEVFKKGLVRMIHKIHFTDLNKGDLDAFLELSVKCKNNFRDYDKHLLSGSFFSWFNKSIEIIIGKLIQKE